MKDAKVIATTLVTNETLKAAIESCDNVEFLQSLVNVRIKQIEKQNFNSLSKEEQLKVIEAENLILAVKTKQKELNVSKKQTCNDYYYEVLTESQINKKARRLIKQAIQDENFAGLFGSYTMAKDKRINSATFGQLIEREINLDQLNQAAKSHTLVLKALSKKEVEKTLVSGLRMEYYLAAIRRLSYCKSAKFAEYKKAEKPNLKRLEVVENV